MARRDRTTGLPRPRGRQSAKTTSRFGDREIRIAVIGTAAVLIAFLVALVGWRIYDDAFRRPEKTILAVGDEKFSLQYYSDRLYLAITQNTEGGTNLSILQQTVLTDLETEGLAIALAKQKGITVSEEEITTEIAAQLGVPVGGAGTSFDTLYRQRLAAVKMSDGAYRRYTKAQVYQQKLSSQFETELGPTGDMVTLRAIVSTSKEAADAVLLLTKASADFGTIAQKESADLESRQKDGLLAPEPPRLLPDTVRAAIADKQPGAEIFGPVQVETNYWIFKIEGRDPQGTFSETQKTQLSDVLFQDAIKASRPNVKIDRNVSSSDYTWANEHAAE